MRCLKITNYYNGEISRLGIIYQEKKIVPGPFVKDIGQYINTFNIYTYNL